MTINWTMLAPNQAPHLADRPYWNQRAIRRDASLTDTELAAAEWAVRTSWDPADVSEDPSCGGVCGLCFELILVVRDSTDHLHLNATDRKLHECV